MKKNFLLLFCIISCTLSAQEFEWVEGGGGDHLSFGSPPWPDRMLGMATDKDGNTYISGSMVEYPRLGDSMIFPPVGGFGGEDALIAKYDKCGNLVWFHIYGGRDNDIAQYMILSPDGSSFITGLYFVGNGLYNSSDSVLLQTAWGDTVVKPGWTCYFYVKVSTETGKILQFIPYDIPAPGGGTYNLEGHLHYMSPNRCVGYLFGQGNTDGTIWNADDCHLALLDSNLNIIKSALLDTGVNSYYQQDLFDYRPQITIDVYGNIYSRLYLAFANPLNYIQAFDTVFAGGGGFSPGQGDGIIFQTDTNFRLKRYIRSNFMYDTYQADENLYLSDNALAGTFYLGNDTFATSGNGEAIIMKIDTTLTLTNYRIAHSSTTATHFPYISLRENKIYACGLIGGGVIWGQDTVPFISGAEQEAVWEISKDSLEILNVYLSDPCISSNLLESNNQNFITSDGQGNIYLGGQYQNILYSIDDTIAANGGTSSPDFYVMKFGIVCTDTIHSLNIPVAPSQLVATATGTRSVQVSWQDNSQYEWSFHIYRSPDGVSGWTLIDTVQRNVTQYTDVNVQPATAYWYQVKAWNDQGESDPTNIDSALTWTITGMAESSESLPYINIYPNPTNGTATLEIYCHEVTSATVRITDIEGAILSEQQTSLTVGYNQQVLSLDQWEAGIYYVTITTAKGQVNRKMIKIN